MTRTTPPATARQPKLFGDVAARKYFALSDRMQACYENFENYLEHYLGNTGLSEWLEELRNTELDEFWTEHVAYIFVLHGKRVPSEIPSILASISREYNVELPVVEGILTKPFWESVAYHNNWPVPHYGAAA